MPKEITTKQSSFEAQPAPGALAIPKEGISELAEMVAFLNDDDNRSIVSQWGKHTRDLKATIKEHVSLEDIGTGMRIQFEGIGEVVIAPQAYAARNIKSEAKRIMRMTVVGV